tara:strand:- start:10725 stop:11231 length:507 start_codon:yes stop_codon:yes gene_type:complete
MVIAETLAGISLVKAAVSGIAQVIGSSEDVGEISGFIDQMFKGAKQLRDADKPVTRAEKIGSFIQSKLGKPKDETSLGAVAQAHIDRLYADEALNNMGKMINQRFGFGTWENILVEQAELVREKNKEAIERKQLREAHHQKLFEIGIGIIALFVGVGGIIFYINWVRR